MNDQQENCILGVCCGKDGKQLKALTEWVTQNTKVTDPVVAQDVAAKLLTSWDFAPKKTLGPLFERIAYLARGYDYE